MFIVLILFISVSCCDAVIYQLTDEEYAQMPPAFHLDPYESCQLDANALYCFSEYALVSDKPSPLLDTIQQYSAHHVSHYNHSKLRYGLCVTQSCQKFYNSEDVDLRFALEACLNESMSVTYDLKVKLLNLQCRNPNDETKTIDGLDIFVGVICIGILNFEIIGTFFDYYCKKDQESRALRCFLCFSLLHNWKKLMRSPEASKNQMMSLESVNGMKVILICLVIIVHSGIILAVTPANPHIIEKSYVSRLFYIPLNIPLLLQSFFILSAFLLIYNLILRSEKDKISWRMLRKRIILRWLRITPAYAFVLALTSTWFAHVTSGPLWNKSVEVEMKDCRQYWWQNMLYINNYFENSECMVHSWFLAADFQLYCLAITIFWACRTPLYRKIILAVLFASGVILPAAQIYFNDLDAVIMISPEAILEVFITDAYFIKVYTPGHTNIIGCAVGIIMGYLVYNWQKNKLDVKKYQRPIYRIFYWSVFILMLYCFYSGGILFDDAPRQPLHVRVLYSAFQKTICVILVAVLMVGCLFKFDGSCYRFLEWHGWKIINHVSYSAYLTHMVLLKGYISSQISLREISFITVAEVIATMLTSSFILAFIFWLLVEAPFNNVVEELMKKKETRKKEQ